MPANLPVEAQKALAKYQVARTPMEKLRALEEALSLIPTHKGTEKLRGRLKRRMAELRREIERRASARSGRRDYFTVPKEGAAQIAVIGAANSGKSTLLKALTNAKPVIASYQLSTTRPIPGMMLYQGIEIQLVELPAILTEELEETQFTGRSLGLAKNADALLILLDGLNNPLQQFTKIVELLDEIGVRVKPPRVEVRVEKKDSGGIRLVVFGTLHGDYREVVQLLRSIGVRDAVVKVYGEAFPEDLEDAVIRDLVYKKTVVALNKLDSIDVEETEELKHFLNRYKIPFTAISAEKGEGLEELKKLLLESLELIRVYTQKDGVVVNKPIVVKRGCTIKTLAEFIHKEVAEKMKYARVWGRSVKLQGQRVGPDHVLEDGDIVEIYV